MFLFLVFLKKVVFKTSLLLVYYYVETVFLVILIVIKRNSDLMLGISASQPEVLHS